MAKKKDEIKVTLVPKDKVPENFNFTSPIAEGWGLIDLQVTYHELSGTILKIEKLESFILERLHYVEHGIFFDLDANHILIVKANGDHILLPIKREGNTVTFENHEPFYFAPDDIAYLEIVEDETDEG